MRMAMSAPHRAVILNAAQRSEVSSDASRAESKNARSPGGFPSGWKSIFIFPKISIDHDSGHPLCSRRESPLDTGAALHTAYVWRIGGLADWRIWAGAGRKVAARFLATPPRIPPGCPTVFHRPSAGPPGSRSRVLDEPSARPMPGL